MYYLEPRIQADWKREGIGWNIHWQRGKPCPYAMDGQRLATSMP